MFWGITLEPGKKYEQEVEVSLHLTMAALDPSLSGVNAGPNTTKVSSIVVEREKNSFIICNLESGKVLQQALDLVFTAGDTVSFQVNGEHKVHLTGYVMPEYGELDDEDMYEDMSDLSDEESEDESVPSPPPKKQAQQQSAKKRKQETAEVSPVGKKAKKDVQKEAVTPVSSPEKATNGSQKQKPDGKKDKQQKVVDLTPPKDSDEDEDDSDDDSDESMDSDEVNMMMKEFDGDEDEDEEDADEESPVKKPKGGEQKRKGKDQDKKPFNQQGQKKQTPFVKKGQQQQHGKQDGQPGSGGKPQFGGKNQNQRNGGGNNSFNNKNRSPYTPNKGQKQGGGGFQHGSGKKNFGSHQKNKFQKRN